jgi:hypothetical protein
VEAQDNRLPHADHHAAAPSSQRNVRFVLTCLPVLGSLVTYPLSSPPPSSSSISAEIHNIFRVVWSGRWAVVTPFALLDALWKFVPRFRNYQQQVATVSPLINGPSPLWLLLLLLTIDANRMHRSSWCIF